MTGQLYAGAIGVFTIALVFGGKESDANLSPGLLIPLMLIASVVAGALLGSIAGFMKGKYNVNEIVVTMMLNFITFWLISFLIKEGGPFMKSGGEGDGFDFPPLFALSLGVPFTIIPPRIGRLLYYVCKTRMDTRSGRTVKASGSQIRRHQFK
jgi:simple sugar transport system permease protein